MTWRTGVAGHPVAHSLSPTLHEAGFEMSARRGTSTRLDIGIDGAATLREVLGSQFDSLSITMPLKVTAATLCDELDATAAQTGSVNSMLWRDGRILGASTDGAGFVAAVTPLLGSSLAGLRVVILGAGGAARAIVHALAAAGVASVTVVGRSPENVERLVTAYPCATTELDGAVDLVVNTVAVSDRGEPETLAGVQHGTLCVDITYEPRVSAWLAHHDQAGCRTQNGLAMLAHQAALQMQWWWGVEIDGAKLLEVIS